MHHLLFLGVRHVFDLGDLHFFLSDDVFKVVAAFFELVSVHADLIDGVFEAEVFLDFFFDGLFALFDDLAEAFDLVDKAVFTAV